jgi:heparan-alpha-glucosaminide N-acetyltransferase
MVATPQSTPTEKSERAGQGSRLASLDAFRGFVMMVLLFDGYLPGLAARFPENPALQVLGRQFSHMDWQGIAFWDLIQPSFMFMVGVAMTYSFHARRSRGEDTATVARHVVTRSLVFIALGLLLASMHYDRTQWKFGELLCQIGLAYPFAYLLLGRKPQTQWLAAAVILAGTWLAFILFPLPGPAFDYATLGISAAPEPFTGFFAHWNKYTNLADVFDRRFLNLLPGSAELVGGERNVATLNFIPSIVTLLFGVMAGDLLRSGRSQANKLRALVLAGGMSLAMGLILGQTICPIVKPLWTPAFVLASTGFVCWFLAIAYWMADIKGWALGLAPMMIVGRNSLVVYLLFRACREPIQRMVEIHVGTFTRLGHSWTFQVIASAAIIWLISLRLYRRKIFISV